MGAYHQWSKQHKKALANHYPDTSPLEVCQGPIVEPRQQQERSADPRPRETDMQDGEQTQPQLPQASTDSESAESSIDQPVYREWSPVPLFSQTVDKLQHDAFGGLLKLQSNEKAQELSQSLDLTGIPYKEWWLKMAATCSAAQWQTKLWAIGTPQQQVGGADNDYIGKLLFQHIDFDGNYYEEPLQTLPPAA